MNADRLLLWVFALCMTCTFEKAHAAERTNVIRLYPVVSLERDRLVLADLTGKVADHRLQRVLETTPLLTFENEPDVMQKVIRRADIVKAFNTGYPRWAGTTEFLGPETIMVRRQRKAVNRQALLAVATACLEKRLQPGGGQYRDIAFKPLGKLGRLAVANGELRLEPRCEGGRSLLAREVVWVDIYVAERLQQSLPVWFQVSGKQLAYVLTSPATKRVRLTDKMVKRMYVDMDRVAGELYTGEPGSENIMFAQPAEAGQILTASMLKPVPAVTLGSIVNVSTHIGNILIEASALAMMDGNIGETVKLKSLSSKKVFRAEVTATNSARAL